MFDCAFGNYDGLLPSFQVCTSKMNLSDEVDLEDYVSRPDKISAADVSAFSLCFEQSLHLYYCNTGNSLPQINYAMIIDNNSANPLL